MGERTGAELGLLTPPSWRALLVRIETKPRTARDALIQDIARLQAQIDAMEVEKARERGEMIFIEVMVFVLGLMLGFAAGRVL
jgi:hypothetical protein